MSQAYDDKLPVLDPRKVLRGKYGQVYDETGRAMVEVTEAEVKVKFNKKKVERGNAKADGNRTMGSEISGKIKMHWTAEIAKLRRSILNDPDAPRTLIFEHRDPDLPGEKVAVMGVTFDEVDLIGFKVKDTGDTDLAFTADDYKFL